MAIILDIIIAAHLLIPILGLQWWAIRTERNKLNEEKRSLIRRAFLARGRY